MPNVDDVFPVFCSVCKTPKWSHEFHLDGQGRRRSECNVCRSKARKLRAKLRTNAAQGQQRREKFEDVTNEHTKVSKKQEKSPVPIQPIALTASDLATKYVITYAQNATPVHERFLTSLQTYCQREIATLLVIPGRYKNPTSIFSDKMEHDEWWDESLHPYLFAGRLVLDDNLAIFGDISIQPTATRPLTGFEVFVGKQSAVFGHPKLQLLTVATAQRRYPRLLTTTGAITLPNYTDSKAGKKGHAHHVLGACVVERGSGGLFHMRQINAMDDGSFIDLDREYDGEMSRLAPRALALVCGDIHDAHRDESVLRATFTDQNSIVNRLRPEQIILNDVLDQDARNHHTISSFTDRYDRHKGTKPDSVEDEVRSAIDFVDMVSEYAIPVVVASNHDEALDKWLQNADVKTDFVNAQFFHRSWNLLLEDREKTGAWTGAFELWYRSLTSSNTAKFLARNEDYLVGTDIHVGFHGDVGLNGSRGSALTFSKLGIKTIIGHSHQPQILDGTYVAGVTGALDQGYNDLPSSWLNSHVIVYANSKRSLISIIDGQWTGCKLTCPVSPQPGKRLHDRETKRNKTSDQG